MRVKKTGISARTNKHGLYTLANVEAGTHTLTYSKEGYGTYERKEVQLVGGNVPALLSFTLLYEIPKIEVQSFDVGFKSNIIRVSGILSEISHYAFFVCISDSHEVLSNNSDLCFGEYYTNDYSPSNEFAAHITLDQTPYSLGDTIYLAVYFFNRNELWQRQLSDYTSYYQAFDIVELVLD